MFKLKKVGDVAVDSGQVLVVDPCYLHEWKHGEFDPDANVRAEPKNSYAAACKMTLGEGRAGEMLIAGKGGTGVVTSSGFGDGCYPALILTGGNKETGGWGNRNLALLVLFDEQPATLRGLIAAIKEMARASEVGEDGE